MPINGTPAATPAQSQAELVARNKAARDFITTRGMPMAQVLASRSVVGAITSANNRLTFQPKLVGLLCGFWIKVNVGVANAGGSPATRTALGALNLVKRIQFVDTNNIMRINITGAHLGLLNSYKQARGYGQNVAPNLPFTTTGWDVQSLASSVAAGMTENAQFYYYVPIAYSQQDLKGAIPLNVISATAQLIVELNDAPGHLAAADNLFKVAGGAGTVVTLSDAVVEVKQVYYDQIYTSRGDMIVPPLDVATQYRIEDTTFSGIVAGSDNPYEYGNYRDFVSTLAFYNNTGTTLNFGTDVNYWMLRYANSLPQWQYGPEDVALLTRNQIGFDPPPATYYFDHRAFPIASANYGNATLVLNPSSAPAGTYLSVGYEFFQQQALALTASSLPGTG